VGRKPLSCSVCIFALLGVLAAFPSLLRAQLSTQDHIADPGFWPTKPGYPRADYLGSEACASCHSMIYSSQINTSMANTAIRASSSKVLLSHSNLHFTAGPFHYAVAVKNSAAVYQMNTPNKKVLQSTLAWAFGTGRVGQSFLFAPKDGTFREARVTYFSALQNLDFTPTRGFSRVKSPEEAMYRLVSVSEIQRCFSCHTTAAFTTEQLDEDKLFTGVTCEACHGPGAKHVATMQSFVLAGASPTGPANIFNPASLSPQDAVDFCGACHATTWDVILSGIKGVSNARAEPYRLESSKCWGKGDARLLCWSCHDPHQQVRSEPESYDQVCMNCHRSSQPSKSASAATQAACPVATSKCVSCHMPKTYVPEMHYQFTDHRIQIALPGDPYRE
jgi:Cytochrome c554 and c-prime